MDEFSTTSGDIPPPQPIVILSFDEIVSAIDVLKAREDIDRQKLVEFSRIADTNLRERLVQWGMAGFCDNHVFYTIQLSVLPRCSDGVIRTDIFEYIEYMLPGFSLVNIICDLESKLPGMKLTYSYADTNLLQIHVTKK